MKNRKKNIHSCRISCHLYFYFSFSFLVMRYDSWIIQLKNIVFNEMLHKKRFLLVSTERTQVVIIH